MTEFSKDMVDNLALKLLIGLTQEENEMVLKEFDVIKEQMDLINQIPNINNINPLTHPFALDNVNLREDEETSSDSIKDILRNASEIEDREVKVLKVVE